MPVRTVLERGPKGKKAVAFAVDWPGWSRGAKTPELALELLESYRERYRPVAVAARMADEFDAAGPLDVVEDQVGPGSTDFWGISFAPSGLEERADGRRRARPQDHAAARVLGVLRRGGGARVRRRCARARVAVGATATRSSVT